MSCIVDNNNNNSEYRPQTVPAYVSIKDDNWRKQVVGDIKINARVLDNSDKNIIIGKHTDPLTNLREVLRTLSNQEAFKYMRQCRLIVAKLKQCWVEVNEEIKALVKSKEYLESAIEHIRKDILINQETIDNRVYRPQRETEQDGVDEILNAEKQNLINVKRSLETALKPIQEQIHKLDETRETVYKLGRERSRVTELICQCLTQALRTYDASTNERNKRGAQNKSKSTSSLGHSAPVTARNLLVGPLSAFTPEAVNMMDVAAQQIIDGKELRRKAKLIIAESVENAKLAGKTVEDYFVKKISETVTLTQNLNVSVAENKLAQNRAVRWGELSDLSFKYSLGPEKYTNLQTYERLDRPIIRTFQKHPGNQVPEASEIIKSTATLADSLKVTEQQIKTLKIVGQRLNSNIKDKEAAASVDCALLRRRRAQADHKWVPQKYIKETQPTLKLHNSPTTSTTAATTTSTTVMGISPQLTTEQTK